MDSGVGCMGSMTGRCHNGNISFSSLIDRKALTVLATTRGCSTRHNSRFITCTSPFVHGTVRRAVSGRTTLCHMPGSRGGRTPHGTTGTISVSTPVDRKGGCALLSVLVGGSTRPTSSGATFARVLGSLRHYIKRLRRHSHVIVSGFCNVKVTRRALTRVTRSLRLGQRHIHRVESGTVHRVSGGAADGILGRFLEGWDRVVVSLGYRQV